MNDLIEALPKKDEVWKHTRSGGHYLIKGMSFNTITDQLDVRYKPLYPSEFSHFTRQLRGCPKAWMVSNDDGTPRFEKVGVIASSEQHFEWFVAPD